MNTILEYSTQFPNLLVEIVLFFSKFDQKNGKIVPKMIYEFSDFYKKKFSAPDLPQPRIISLICEKLVEYGHLSVLERKGPDGLNNSYISFVKDPLLEKDKNRQQILNNVLSLKVFGFPYIYNSYRNFVLPIEFTNWDNRKTLGTCFAFLGGIATAKHCVSGAKALAIGGIDSETLTKASFYIHRKEAMDLLFIQFQSKLESCIRLYDTAIILDEVMTLGYPKVPGYHNFLASEKANVSARFTSTRGQVSAHAEDLWIRERLLLITARISGGNSGGPVINRAGAVVGISVNAPDAEGDYDDLGYGVAIPINFFVDEVMNGSDKEKLDVSKISFGNLQI